jgi:hypothetical protein
LVSSKAAATVGRRRWRRGREMNMFVVLLYLGILVCLLLAFGFCETNTNRCGGE